ncbi:hypothetical protein [Leptolyngbya sp. FACHB-261]|uniref:hypothetical protein n=1 Tax=Leptolyngbya sp. FACHB-261 TaxID=2692806 RepID=UPI0016895DFA|nr:hypothetical protein [Leptolyngbya sp. FACHB-261]MBD2103089.1 hypothetical protein [Leptolyngbya sp. FACHB-261]
MAPHFSDPPHTPDSHTWIAFDPPQFVSDQAECTITVDTVQLMADKTYVRKLLLHTNSALETHSLVLKVQTAPVPVPIVQLPYLFWGLLLTGSGAMAWVTALAVAMAGAGLGVAVAASAAVSFGAAAGALATAGAEVGAATSVVAGLGAISAAAMLALVTGVSTVGGTLTAMGAGTGAVIGGLTGAGLGLVGEQLVERGFSHALAISIALLTALLGIGLGISLAPGYLSIQVGVALLLTGLPLAALVLQPLLRRTSLLVDHRRRERHLIQP